MLVVENTGFKVISTGTPTAESAGPATDKRISADELFDFLDTMVKDNENDKYYSAPVRRKDIPDLGDYKDRHKVEIRYSVC